MLAPEYLVLRAVNELMTAGESIKKHTKFDKGGCLSNLWVLSRHGWHRPSVQRTEDTIKHAAHAPLDRDPYCEKMCL